MQIKSYTDKAAKHIRTSISIELSAYDRVSCEKPLNKRSRSCLGKLQNYHINCFGIRHACWGVSEVFSSIQLVGYALSVSDTYQSNIGHVISYQIHEGTRPFRSIGTS